MKRKEQLARDYCMIAVGADATLMHMAYIAGLEKGRELAAEHIKTQASWVCEGVNQGEITMRECVLLERELHSQVKQIKRIGEEEIDGPR